RRRTAEHQSSILEDAITHGEWPDDTLIDDAGHGRQVDLGVAELRVDGKPGQEFSNSGDKGIPIAATKGLLVQLPELLLDEGGYDDLIWRGRLRSRHEPFAPIQR